MILLPNDYWEIKQTRKKGRGVFAKKDIEAGTVIGDYIGRIIPGKEEEKYDKKGIYLMYYSEKASIYPDVKKPGVHILNHSCLPNSWMYTYKGHTLYFTLRKIFKGEELTVAYLVSPQDKDCNPCDHLCYCNEDLCTQTMHLSEKRYKKWEAFDNAMAKKTKKAKVPHNTILPMLDSYPKVVKDNPIYTLFGNLNEKSLSVGHSTMPEIKTIRELIRTSGRTISFPNLNLTVLGVQEGVLVTKPNATPQFVTA